MSTFIEKLKKRRSYREFSNETFDIELLIEAIEGAKHSPSGANKQPWTFCIVKDSNLKKKIREESENIEKKFYQNISTTWKADLKTLQVNTKKEFLEKAPYLIVIFKHVYQLDELNQKTNVYYPDISIGIATGILIAALTDLGIDILTYTPQPNKFLSTLLDRPKNEKPYLILVCGKGSQNYKLPNINKKPNSEIIKIY